MPNLQGLQYETKAQVVEKALKERLLRGEYQPGFRLRVDQLSKQLRVSPTPIKEALRRLTAQGFLVYEPHHGVQVKGLSLEDAREIYMLRQMAEGQAAYLAARRVTPADVRGLERLQRELRKSAQVGDMERVSAISRDFHMRVYDCARSPRLLTFIESLWAAFPRPLAWQDSAREAASIAEHDELITSLGNGEGERARGVIETHLEHALAFVEAQFAARTTVTAEESA